MGLQPPLNFIKLQFILFDKFMVFQHVTNDDSVKKKIKISHKLDKYACNSRL